MGESSDKAFDALRKRIQDDLERAVLRVAKKSKDERDPFGPPVEFDAVGKRQQAEALNVAKHRKWRRICWFALGIDSTLKGSAMHYDYRHQIPDGPINREACWIQELDDEGNVR